MNGFMFIVPPAPIPLIFIVMCYVYIKTLHLGCASTEFMMILDVKVYSQSWYKLILWLAQIVTVFR